jgi:hypothetical protein
MTGKQKHTRDPSALGGDPSRQRGTKHVGGSPPDDCNRTAVDTVTRRESDARAREERYQAAIDGRIGVVTQDDIDAMLAEQMLATHGAAMDCYRSAAEASEGPARRHDLALADKLARSFAALAATQRRSRRTPRRTITSTTSAWSRTPERPAAPFEVL